MIARHSHPCARYRHFLSEQEGPSHKTPLCRGMRDGETNFGLNWIIFKRFYLTINHSSLLKHDASAMEFPM